MDCSNPLCMANCPDDIDDFFLYIGLHYGGGGNLFKRLVVEVLKLVLSSGKEFQDRS